MLLTISVCLFFNTNNNLKHSMKINVDLKNQIEIKTNDINQLNNIVEKRNEEIKQSKKNITEKDSKIESLQGEVEDLKKTNSKLKLSARGDSTPNNNNNTNRGQYLGKMSVTAYTSGYESTGKKKGDKGYGITASGSTVKDGRTIATSKNIPFGTVLYIEGIGERVVEDRGGAITNNRIDLYMNNLNDAITFGRQERDVYIVR